jgi:hypothetical protein
VVRLRLALRRRSTVTIRLSRHTAHGWKTSRRLHRRAKAGKNTIAIRARGLRPGRYRLVVGARARGSHTALKRTLRLTVRR